MDAPITPVVQQQTCECDPRTEDLVRAMLVRLADKWTLQTIEILSDGEMRFSRLRERLGGVSQKMLTQTLRQLERDGLVTRHVHPVVPPRVDYRLTPLGASLSEALCALWIWADEHCDVIAHARMAYDQQQKSRPHEPA